MNNANTLLSKLYQDERLAHFYLVKCSGPTQPKNLIDWTHQWIKSIGVLNPDSHSDILWIPFAEHEGSNYVVADIEEIFKFNEYLPLTLKYKFIIIKDAAKLTTAVSNKLLKVLEEPAPKTCILLLNPRSNELLPTISSRAINLNIPHQGDEDLNKLALGIEQEIDSGLTLSEFIEKYKKTPDIDREFLKSILSGQHKKQTHKIIELTKELESAKTYNTALSSRLTKIYYFFK